MALSLNSGEAESLGILTIALSGQKSGYLTSDDFYGFNAIQISAPAALTDTVSIEILKDASLDETSNGSWGTLQSPSGTDVTIPAGKVLIISIAGFVAMRLSSAAPEGAARDFYVVALRNRPSG